MNKNFGDLAASRGEIIVNGAGDSAPIKVCEACHVNPDGSSTSLGAVFDAQPCLFGPADITVVNDTRIDMGNYTGPERPVRITE